MTKKGNGITEEKAKRIAVGATVAGVLLIVFLIVIMIIQFVQMGVKGGKTDDLDDAIRDYSARIEQGEKDLKWYESGEGLYYLARQMGKK